MIGTGSILSVSRVITRVGHTEGWHCANPTDAKSVALTKISVDHVVERGSGAEEVGRCLLTSWKIKANIKPWGKSD